MREVVFPEMFTTEAFSDTQILYEKDYPVEASITLSETFTITAYDRVGNRSGSTPFTVIKDSTPPELVLNVPADSGLILPVSWTGSDDLSGVASYDVQVRAGEGPWTGWLTGTQRTEAEFVGSEGVSYSFQVRATDRVGNTSAWTTSGSSSVQGMTKYYSFNGQRVALRQGTGSGSKVYYLHGDHLGSVSLVTDGAGSTVSESRYAPFGELRWTRGASLTDFSFTGQRADGFGLLDYHARFYSAKLGRFISADTIVPGPGNPLAWDRYAYVQNNPLRYTDPSGHCPDDDGDGACDPPTSWLPNGGKPTAFGDPEISLDWRGENANEIYQLYRSTSGYWRNYQAIHLDPLQIFVAMILSRESSPLWKNSWADGNPAGTAKEMFTNAANHWIWGWVKDVYGDDFGHLSLSGQRNAVFNWLGTMESFEGVMNACHGVRRNKENGVFEPDSAYAGLSQSERFAKVIKKDDFSIDLLYISAYALENPTSGYWTWGNVVNEPIPRDAIFSYYSFYILPRYR